VNTCFLMWLEPSVDRRSTSSAAGAAADCCAPSVLPRVVSGDGRLA